MWKSGSSSQRIQSWLGSKVAEPLLAVEVEVVVCGGEELPGAPEAVLEVVLLTLVVVVGEDPGRHWE
jgi:hypothetical protein